MHENILLLISKLYFAGLKLIMLRSFNTEDFLKINVNS